jgi:tape measure domain-containing protein
MLAAVTVIARAKIGVYDISQDTRTAYDGTIDIYTRMARATQQLGTTQAELFTVTEAINKSLIISGSSATAAEAALIQLGQGLQSGTLRGEELNSVLEQTPRLAQALADGMGIPLGKLREFGKDGKITSDNLINALLDQADNLDREYTRMGANVGQAMTVLNNSFGHLISGANKSTSATELLAGAIIDVAGNIDQWADSNRALIDQKLPEYIDKFKGNIDDIWNFLSANHDIMEYGLVGLAIGGRKGALLLAGYAAFADTWENYVTGIRGQTQYLMESQEAMRRSANVPMNWSSASGSNEFLNALRSEQGDIQIGMLQAHADAVEKVGDKYDKAGEKVNNFGGIIIDTITEKWATARQSLLDQTATAGLTGLARELAEIDIKAAGLRAEFGQRGEIDTWAASMREAAVSAENLKDGLAMQEHVSALFEQEMERRNAATREYRDLMDELSMAVLPEHVRQVEEINRRYAGLERQVTDLAGEGFLTLEQAQQWVDGLGANMASAFDSLAKKEQETLSVMSFS